MPIKGSLTRSRYWNIHRSWDLQLHHGHDVAAREQAAPTSVEENVWIPVQAICPSHDVFVLDWTRCVSLDQIVAVYNSPPHLTVVVTHPWRYNGSCMGPV